MTPAPTTSHGRRALVLLPIVLAGLSMVGPFSIDTPFPAFQAMGRDLDATSAQMQLVVSAYLLAFAVMSPVHGPLSDALGRRPVILTGIALYAAASIGCALSTSLPMLLVFRVFQGLCAGGGVIVGRTVIRDLYDGPEAQRLMSRVMMIFGVGPALSPIVGGFLLRWGTWPLIFWFMGGFAVLLIVVIALTLPESHPPERRTPFAVRPLLASLVEVAGHLPAHRVIWAAALSFGGQFLYIGGAAIFVVDLLGKGEQDFWMLFGPMIAGIVLGSWISARTAGRVSGTHLVTGSLVVGLVGCAVNIVLAALPATVAALPYAVIGPTLIAVGIGAAYPTEQLILMDMFPDQRGAVVSLFTFCTLILNAFTAAVVVPWVSDSVLSLALAAGALVVAGFGCWLLHLRALPGTGAEAEEPDPVEPIEQL